MYPVVAGPIPEVRPPEVRSRAWAVAAASPKVEEVGRAGKAVAFREEAVDKVDKEVRSPEEPPPAAAAAAMQSEKVEEVGRAGKAVAFPEEAVDKALESRLDSDLERCNSLHL